MWDYINQKFILPIESKKWVMQALCRAWKKYKGEVKQNHFMKYKTTKQMLKNRPLEIPEVQFRKLIRYWRLPEIKAMSAKNIENRSKQTCPHRTGSTGFGIVRKQLRDSKENNEEPSRAEIFTVTRTSRKGKEIDPKSQSTIRGLGWGQGTLRHWHPRLGVGNAGLGLGWVWVRGRLGVGIHA
ncbi:hypothetical protein PIB30_084662 [Stylosanthes scabra]|uniref:Uncharacterized protein n=1 Tax=Stylosanthes scabra TaxID=79078 RepID=A0ABU6ZRE0_9FABA|nr:hypothetical protein [Stylosanthes scabra]